MFKKILYIALLFSFLGLNASQIDFESITTSDSFNVTTGQEKILQDKFILLKDGNYFNDLDIKIINTSNRQGFARMDISSLIEDNIFNVEINYKQNQNVVFFDYVEYEVTFDENKLISYYLISGRGEHDNEYYSETNNLYGQDLQNKLTEIINKDYVERSYKAARQLMWSSFDNLDGFVECVYTGDKVETEDIPNVNTTHFNTEHTWPRAYGAKDEPELSDLFHIYPTTEQSNSRRANYPFGFVESNATWEKGGSKLGTSISGREVFEARDYHKGNVARSIFYFATMYGNIDNFLDDQQEADLRKWMDIDPVDDRELARNDSIYKYQGNRNPFIDHSEFLYRIDDFNGKNSVQPDSLIQYEYDIAIEVDPDEPVQFPILIVNPNHNAIQIEEIKIDDESTINHDIESPLNIGPFDLTKIYFDAFFEKDKTNNRIEFTIAGIDQKLVYNLKLIHKATSVENNDIGLDGVKLYPNPAFSEITIEFDKLNYIATDLYLEIYDFHGNKVFFEDSEKLNGNKYEYVLNINLLKKYGNTFFYVIRNNEEVINKEKFLLKK